MNNKDKIVEDSKSRDCGYGLVFENENASKNLQNLIDLLIAAYSGDMDKLKGKHEEIKNSYANKDFCEINEYNDVNYWRERAKQAEKDRDRWKNRAEVSELALDIAEELGELCGDKSYYIEEATKRRKEEKE